FFQKMLSRSVEFRCDRDAAYAFGGNRIATGLAMLGPGSYFSIFATHPRTKTRIKKVERVSPHPGHIRVPMTTHLVNVLSLGSVFYVWYKIASIAPLAGVLEGLKSLGQMVP